MSTKNGQLRLSALVQAAGDLAGVANSSAEDIVARAEIYYRFLTGEKAPKKATKSKTSKEVL